MISNSSPLLINESPLQVLPSLAVALGNINEAIILQQIQYWINNPKSGRYGEDGRKYIRDTVKEWHAQFPWLTEKAIRNRLKSLEEKKIILIANLNKHQYDRTKWYAIDYDVLNSLLSQHKEETSTWNRNKVPNSNGTKFLMQTEGSTDTIPKTSSKISSETSTKKYSASDDAPHMSVEALKIEFEELWSLYPNKKGKKQAFSHYKTWRKANKKHTKDYIEHKLDDYIAYIEQNRIQPRYIMHGSTWFNGRFDDELEVESHNQPTSAGFEDIPGS